jgi:prophage antirepressor-like protein
MTITIGGKEHHIKLSGTIDDPYFCGTDVCDVLGHEASKKALQRYVEHDDKQSLSVLRSYEPNKVGTSDVPTLLGSFEPLTYNEGKAVYVNESGLYSLILSSEAPFAKEFRRLVCKVILPSIRKYGCYHAETKLSEAMEQLAIKEKSELDLKREQEELKRELEVKEQLEEELQVQLAHEQRERELQERFTNKLRDIVTVMKSKQKDQIIYIATTKTYAKQNRFKIGGVKSRSLLRGRLSTYNTGRPVGDKMYFAYLAETTDYQHLEQRIKRIIGDHIDTNEMYNLHYDSVQPLVEYLADRFDEEVTYHKSLFDTLVKDTLCKEPRVPEPILLNGAEFRKIRNGQVVSVQVMDFDEMGETEKVDFVRSVFEEFSVLNGEEPMRRRDFEVYLADHHNVKFAKMGLWSVTKKVANEFKKKIKF